MGEKGKDFLKKRGLLLGIIVAVVIIFIVIPIASYNSLTSCQTDVEEGAANIDTQLKRRADLTPNLVNAVKGYTKHETEIFNSVTEARKNMMNAETMEEKSEANDKMTVALSKLVAIAESYPLLKADTVYTGLMDELAGTENRIAVVRTKYNEAVKTYNKKIKQFPSNLFAGFFGFDKAEYFEAGAGAENVPEVNFD